MAKKKALEVQKFGGVDHLGSLHEQGNRDAFHSEMSGKDYTYENTNWETLSGEAESKTKLEDDQGHGNAAIIRCFEFAMNPEAFREYAPTKQELFNSHYKGIEIALWRDGMKVIPEVNPRIVVKQDIGRYQIFVGAAPMKGHTLREKPNTLSELVRSESYGNE